MFGVLTLSDVEIEMGSATKLLLVKTKSINPTDGLRLVDLYEIHGSNWSLIAEYMSTERNADACRSRYDRIAKRAKRAYVWWTPEEEEELLELFEKHGPDWAKIAECMSTGRGADACHMRYRRLPKDI